MQISRMEDHVSAVAECKQPGCILHSHSVEAVVRGATAATLSRVLRPKAGPVTKTVLTIGVGPLDCRRFGWGRSSVGRAPQWHCGGQGFESPRLHQPRKLSGLPRRSRLRCATARRGAKRSRATRFSSITPFCLSRRNALAAREQLLPLPFDPSSVAVLRRVDGRRPG
jgi:hypothetical protein